MGSFTEHCAFFASILTYFLKVTGCCGNTAFFKYLMQFSGICNERMDQM